MEPMTQITSSEIVELCRHVPIHKIIGSPHVARKIKILCPKHQEKTPSCVLFPTGGWKCFGCGAGGNSVDFVMGLGCSFEEAIAELKKYI